MRILATLVLTAAFLGPLLGRQDPAKVLAIKAGKIFTAAEKTYDDGVILVEGGKIKAVGQVPVPAGAEVLEFPAAWATPGLIDLHCHIAGTGLRDINEMVHPANPELSTRPTIDPDSDFLKDALAGGVTTVLYIPGSGTNISGFGTLMHTGGGATTSELIVRFPGAMKVAQAWNPERMGGDLGMSRMGMWWGLRSVLQDAKAYHETWTAFEKGQTKVAPARREDLEMMRGLFQHKWPVIIHTADARDVMSTVRIFHDEFQIPLIVSHGEFGGYKAAPEIARRNLAANIGPRTYDWTIMVQDGHCLGIASKYFDAGVKKLSINTDSPVVPEEELIVQAAMSVRLGLPEETALRAVTIEPARAALVGERLGSLEPGKDADIVLWTGNPLDVRNRPVLCIIGGKVAYDERKGRRVTFGGGW
ncbi:MAG TPA: amidohydrolase family protein [Planctomycetota bacterium]|nr:amidohydrolase family protein [Planctomycetota bacterium]